MVDILREVGFSNTHVWMREMADLSSRKDEEEEVEMDERSEFEPVTEFNQVDSWNAYIVASSLDAR